MTQTRLDRRTVLAVGTLGITASVFGVRAVIAQDEKATPGATPAATPGATPAATPGASPAAAAGARVTVTAVDIDFNPDQFSIPADTAVEIHVVNEGTLTHDFIIEDTEYGTELLDPGAETTLTVNLPAGEYIYYCSVPGHREAGMEGTLAVG